MDIQRLWMELRLVRVLVYVFAVPFCNAKCKDPEKWTPVILDYNTLQALKREREEAKVQE